MFQNDKGKSFLNPNVHALNAHVLGKLTVVKLKYMQLVFPYNLNKEYFQ